MDLLDMKGSWGWLPSVLYERVIGEGFVEEFDSLVDRLAEGWEGGSCLDVGCGPGHVTVGLAARFPEREAMGIDTSPRMIHAARERAKRTATWNAHFELGDAAKLAFASDSVGLVFSVSSIKHWAEPLRGLREMHRVAAPGATVFILEVDRGVPSQVVREFVSQWRLTSRWEMERFPRARRLAEAYFHHIVAGQSYDLEDIRGMMQASPFEDWRAERVEGMPLWVVEARKAPNDENKDERS